MEGPFWSVGMVCGFNRPTDRAAGAAIAGDVLLESEPDNVLSYVRRGCDLEPVLVIVNFGGAGIAKIELTPEATVRFEDVYDTANDNEKFSFRDADTILIPVEANSLRVPVPYRDSSMVKN